MSAFPVHPVGQTLAIALAIWTEPVALNPSERRVVSQFKFPLWSGKQTGWFQAATPERLPFT